MSVLRRFDGTDWVVVAGPTDPARYRQGLFADRPAPTADDIGTFYWATDQATTYYCDGTDWQRVLPDVVNVHGNEVHSSDFLTAADVSDITDHGLLSGLGDDDHPHYALASGARDFTGEITAPDVKLGVTSILGTGTVSVDFAADGLQTQTLTGNVTYSSANLATGRSVTIQVACDATTRTLGFPAGWRFVGIKPTDIEANKVGILALTAFGATDADVVAAWAAEE